MRGKGGGGAEGRSARAQRSAGHLRVLVTMISLDEAVGTIVKTFPRAGRAILQRAVTI